MHACCMHTCQDWVSQNWIDMMSVHDAQIIRVFFNHHLTGLHAIFLHEVQNVCHLSRLCVLVVIPKSKWYVAFQTPTLCYFYFAKEEVLVNTRHFFIISTRKCNPVTGFIFKDPIPWLPFRGHFPTPHPSPDYKSISEKNGSQHTASWTHLL